MENLLNFGENLLRYNKQQRYLLFDFETTNLNLFFAQPWQLSWIEFDLNGTYAAQNRFIWHENLKMGKEAAIITNFNYDKYKAEAVPAKEVLKEIDEKLYDEKYIITGHNILGFDIFIHKTLRRLCGVAPDYSYLDRCLDTNCLAKAHKKGFKFDGDNRLLWQKKISGFFEKGMKTNLASLSKELQIPFEQNKLHDAQYDANLNVAVLKKLLWLVDI